MSKILDNFNEADFANLDNESLAQMINSVSLVDDISQIDPLRMNSLITTAIERMEVSDDVRYELGRKLFENNAITENLTENNFDLDGFKSAIVEANINGVTQKQDYKPDLDLMVKHFNGEIDVDGALGERSADLFLKNAAILSLYGESDSFKDLPEYEQNKISNALKTFDHFSDSDFESVERYKNVISEALEANGNKLEAVENLEQEVNKAMEERFDFGAGTISNRPIEDLIPTREELIQEKLKQIRIEEIDWVKRYNDYLNSLGDEVMIMSSGEKMKEKLRGQNGFSPMNARLFGDSIVTIDKYGHAQDTVFNMAPNGSSMTLSKSFSYADPKQTEKMFHLAALKARSSGWEKIYLSHPGPNANAELFLERSINAMLDVDYDLSVINVPKKYQYVLDKIKLERPEISQEAKLNVEYANINTPKEPEADLLEVEEPVLDNPELERQEFIPESSEITGDFEIPDVDIADERIYLEVPFSEKEEARRLAKEAGFNLLWDSTEKSWYAPEGANLDTMQKWNPVRDILENQHSTQEAETPAVEEPAFDDVEFDNPEVATQEVETPEVAVQEIEDPLSASAEIEPEALEEPTVDELTPPEYDMPPVDAYEQQMNQDYDQVFDNVEFEAPEVAAQEIENPAVEEPAFDDVEFVNPSIDTPEARLEANVEKLKDVFGENLVVDDMQVLYKNENGILKLQNLDPNANGVDIDNLINKISNGDVRGVNADFKYMDLLETEVSQSYLDKNNPRNENLKTLINKFDFEKDADMIRNIIETDRLERSVEISNTLVERKDEIENISKEEYGPINRVNKVLESKRKAARDNLSESSRQYLKEEIKNYDPENKEQKNKLDSAVLFEGYYDINNIENRLQKLNSKEDVTGYRLQELRDNYEKYDKPKEVVQEPTPDISLDEDFDLFADVKKEQEPESQRRRNGRGMGR